MLVFKNMVGVVFWALEENCMIVIRSRFEAHPLAERFDVLKPQDPCPIPAYKHKRFHDRDAHFIIDKVDCEVH